MHSEFGVTTNIEQKNSHQFTGTIVRESDVDTTKKIAEFWDYQYDQKTIVTTEHPEAISARQHALQWFGSVKNKTVLDLGCGFGNASIFFANHGAKVIAVDISQKAIDHLAFRAEQEKIPNISAYCTDATRIDDFGRIDFVFGQFILHHIEPFDLFCKNLSQNLGGKGYFWENSASNNVLMWFRNNIVGKWGVPKVGDDFERPFSNEELNVLRKYFQVETETKEMWLTRMAAFYLLRGKGWETLTNFDKMLYNIRILRRLSYFQHIKISKA